MQRATFVFVVRNKGGRHGVQEDPRFCGTTEPERLGPLLSIFSRWFGARARTRDKAVSPLGRTHRRIALASRQKQSVNVHVHAETFIQPRSSTGTSRGEKKGGEGDRRDRDCGRLNGSTTDERVRNASERLDVARLHRAPVFHVNEESHDIEKIGTLVLGFL